MPQMEALEAYWREVPPSDVLMAAWLGYEKKSDPPRLEVAAPMNVGDPEVAHPKKQRLTQSQVQELFQMFPSGKISIN